MFTQSFQPPAPSPTSHAAPAPPPGVTRRNSRLRGLSFLRNYANAHFLFRDPEPQPAPATPSAAPPPQPPARSRSSRVPFRPRAASLSANDSHGSRQTDGSNSNAPPAPTRSRSTRVPRSNRFSAIGIPGFSSSTGPPPTSANDSSAAGSTIVTPASTNPETPPPRRGLGRNRSLRSGANRLSTITIPGLSSFTSTSLSTSASSNNHRSDTPPPAPAAVDPAQPTVHESSESQIPGPAELPASEATGPAPEPSEPTIPESAEPPAPGSTQPPVPQANVTEPGSASASASATHTTTTDTRATSSPQPATSTPDADDAAMIRGRENSSAMPSETLPSIRFSAYYDARAARPSLTFQPVSRTLPSGSEVIKVGRYSERDAQPQVAPNVPSASPVGFKSKVVSRRHCEFWFENGKWHIRDVKSSSGTFLNHIRLSPPGTESKPYVVNDGDIIQLGIDFKGGEEMIFRCVKMRLELNRGWQNKLNTFNMSTHKQLRSLVANGTSGSAQDCSICLNAVAPCQSLFVAPCSHTWHYKCIRSLLNSPQYPIFVCPNCRAAADLEADVDEPCEEWQQISEEDSVNSEANSESNNDVVPPLAGPSSTQERETGSDSGDVADMTMQVDMATPPPPQASPPVPERIQHTMSEPVPIPPVVSAAAHPGCAAHSSAAASSAGGAEGPITPRNNAGPWVFDGTGNANGLPLSGLANEMRSLDSAALDTATRP